MFLTIAFLLAGLILLVISSERTVKYTSKISDLFGISGISAGFIILALATSLPELSVSINSALRDASGISVGNIFGSNIANITIILGLSLFLSRRFVKIKRKDIKSLIQFLFIASIIPLFILQTGRLTFFMGIILIGIFIIFTLKIPRNVRNVEDFAYAYKKDKIFLMIKLSISIIFLILSSDIVVNSSIQIAEIMMIPSSVIGAIIIGLGTSLPELSTTIHAFKKRLFDIGLGNILGSCIINLTLILGATSIFSAGAVNIVSFGSLFTFGLLSTVVVWYLVSSKKIIYKKEASILLVLYLIFILQELGISIFLLF